MSETPREAMIEADYRRVCADVVSLTQQRDALQIEVERLGDLCDALLCEKSVAEAQWDALQAALTAARAFISEDGYRIAEPHIREQMIVTLDAALALAEGAT